MTPKPKKNTRKEIRGWAVVNERGKITMTYVPALGVLALNIFDTKDRAQFGVFGSENQTVKPCRIILD